MTRTPADYRAIARYTAGVLMARQDYYDRVYGRRCRHCTRFVSPANPVCRRCKERRGK